MYFSLFNHVEDNIPQLMSASWPEFIDWMTELAPRGVAAKVAAGLWSPAIYAPGITRGANNADHADALVIDADDVGNKKDKIITALRGYDVDHLVHGSWNDTEGHAKFRIVLPVDDQPDTLLYKMAIRSAKRWFEGLCIIDRAPTSIASLFYLPATGANGRPATLDAWAVEQTLTARMIVEAYPEPQPSPTLVAIRDALRNSFHNHSNGKLLHHDTVLNSDLVRGKWLDTYYQARKGTHHVEMYRLLCRVAVKASGYKYPLSIDELTGIATEIDGLDIGGPYYPESKLRRQAADAIHFALTKE